jgi:hypothetical protein
MLGNQLHRTTSINSRTRDSSFLETDIPHMDYVVNRSKLGLVAILTTRPLARV